MRGGPLVVITLPIALLAGTRVAPAAEPKTRLRFEVDAPCSDARDFARRVSERTPRVTPSADAGVDVVEVVVRGTTPAAGTFRIVPPDGEPSAERRVDGAACEEVADALSLAVALAYDPEATFSPRTPAPVAPPERVPAAPPPSPAQPVAFSPPPPLRASVGMHLSAAAARHLPIGVLVFGEVAGKRTSARLAFGVQRAYVSVAGRSADFTWALLVPDVCSFRFTTAAVELSPCLGVSMGLVDAQPRDIPGAESYVRAWIAPKPALRARAYLGEVAALEAQLGLEVPLVRDRYTFGSLTAYEVPPVLPSFAVGVAFAP